MKRLLLLPALVLLSAATPGKRDAAQPISVSADRFVAAKDAATSNITGTYSGNVIITQGEIRMRSDTVRIKVIGGKPDKIYADGHVVVDSASGTATGDSGVYDVAPRLVTLNGHVVLTKDKNVMRGAQLTVNLVTGVATLGGGVGTRVNGQAGGNGRVQGIFTPPPQTGGK
jgi:lipopolysaccharide export system protein LptA